MGDEKNSEIDLDSDLESATTFVPDDEYVPTEGYTPSEAVHAEYYSVESELDEPPTKMAKLLRSS